MKIFMYIYLDCWCCHVLIQLLLIFNVFHNVFSKCTLDKEDIKCFGNTWKQDLLPIENNSVEKLYISRCTESQAQTETVDINFLRNVTKLTLLSMTHCALIRPPIVNYQINSVETIDLSNNLIDTNAQFPILGLDFFKRFPNLRVLNLTSNKLTHLPKSWFDCPSLLEIIILDDNFIAGLNPSLGSCFVKLKQMSLKGNQFERIRMPSEPRKVFNGAFIRDSGGLKLFADQNNMIRQASKKSGYKEEKISRGRNDYLGVFPKFKALESLDLSYNKISSIDQIPLSYLENIVKLNISYNRLSLDVSSTIHEIGCDFGTAPFYINGKTGITDLDLSGNLGLTRIHSCWTFGLNNLLYMRIANCSISSIYDLSFDKMKSLTLLDLSYNKLSAVPKEITVVAKSLTRLNLAHNNISQMTSSYLSLLGNLRHLNISHNQFQNLMTFPISESDSKLPDSFADFPSGFKDSSSDEPIHLLAKMKHLRNLDLSFNEFRKLSAITDLSPFIRSGGQLESIDLRGNPTISQFSDFNANEMTSTVREFLIDNNLRLHCDCILLGFINWINSRQLEVTGKCASPKFLSHMYISDPKLAHLIISNSSCTSKSSSLSPKATYRLKMLYNANVSIESTQSDNDPMDDVHQTKSSNQKKQIDYQKWVMMGHNLTLQCEFVSSYPIQVPISIEWQRLKMKPIESNYYSGQDSQQSLNIFLRNDKSEQLDQIKYGEKIEHLNSHYDPRIKIAQIGPVDEDTVVDNYFNVQTLNKTPMLHLTSSFKYVGFFLLKPVFLSDIGRYRCLINGLPALSLYGQSQLISKEENIKVFTPPRFTSTPSNLIAIIEGDTVEITCRAVGNPPPMTSLSRIGSKDFPAAKGRRMRIYKDDSSFFITSVRQVDTGNYSCTSRNVAGIISYNFTLKVQMPATILNKNQPRKTIKMGEPLIIGFKVDGVPMPDVKWYKDGQIITENDRIRFSSDELMLVIQSTVLSDAGLYKISILNALGGNEAFVSVVVLDSSMHDNSAPSPTIKIQSSSNNHSKDVTWMPDYWLSGIIITVILSFIITSILWITIFFCFTKIMGSKKRRLLLISNSQSRVASANRPLITTNTSNSNSTCIQSMFRPLRDCSIPLSLTTSTLVPHDGEQDPIDLDIDTFTDNILKSSSDFYSAQLFHNHHQYSNNNVSINNGSNQTRFLSISGIDLSSNKISEPCDSGIDSSQVYSETLNSSDNPLSSLCHKSHQNQSHKSKHRNNHQKQQRKRYVCSTSSESNEALKSTAAVNRLDVRNTGDGLDETLTEPDYQNYLSLLT